MAEDEETTKLYAERYAFLREQFWNESFIAVVTWPKQSLELGADCPSKELLDDLIDTLRAGKHITDSRFYGGIGATNYTPKQITGENGFYSPRDAKDCAHEWVSAKNEVVESGYYCPKCHAISDSAPVVRIYVAARVSRAQTFVEQRKSGRPIISSWIDEAGDGETKDFKELWTRIEREIKSCTGLLFYADVNDAPWKGALIEVGMAMAFGKPIAVVLIGELQPRSRRPVGSWLSHPLVSIYDNFNSAYQALGAASAPVAGNLAATPSPEGVVPAAGGGDTTPIGYRYLRTYPFGGKFWDFDYREKNGRVPILSEPIYSQEQYKTIKRQRNALAKEVERLKGELTSQRSDTWKDPHRFPDEQ